MQVKVRFLDNLKLEAYSKYFIRKKIRFKDDDFSIITDQPIRYKGDGTAIPGAF